MGKILCFGELLLRFTPAPDSEWLKTNEMNVYLGGAELNVATALARWQLPVLYSTALPDHFLSRQIIGELQNRQLVTDRIFFSGERIGTYYLMPGMDLKTNAVIYDRAHSAFGELKTGMLPWDEILHDVSWFHFSAISPALNDSVAAVCLEALVAASKRNITISIDLNFRASLWKQRQPHAVMSELLSYCDVVMGNIWSAHDLLGIPLDHALLEKKDKTHYLQHAHQSAIKIQKRFARVKTVANTFRFDEGRSGVRYFASLYSAHQAVDSPEFHSEEITERVGTGDCFMAGLIYGIHQHWPQNKIILFAAAAGFGKFFEPGDATGQTLESIQARIQPHV